MKKHTKKLVVLITVLMLLFTVTACGGGSSDSQFVGQWEATNISYSGIEMSPADAGLEFSVDVKDDGSVTAVTNGEEEGEGEWTEEGDTITITDGSGSELTGTMDGDKLIIDFGEDFLVTMEKK